jgi:hypothetical protein
MTETLGSGAVSGGGLCCGCTATDHIPPRARPDEDFMTDARLVSRRYGGSKAPAAFSGT